MNNSYSLRGKRISDSFPKLVQVVDNILYDGLGNEIDFPSIPVHFKGSTAPASINDIGSTGDYKISGPDFYFHDGSSWWKLTGSTF